MSIVKRFQPLKDLDELDVLIDDVNSSPHIVITDMPQSLPQGKSSFLIETGPYMADGVELQFDFVDSSGESIYYEPVADYLEGTSRRISVEVYSDTAAGPANLIVVGELDEIPTAPGLFADTEPVPEEFQGVYNVRLTKEVIINPVAVNTQPIRFYTQPQIKVSERRLGTMERTDPAAPIVTDVFNVEGVPADGFAFKEFSTEEPKQGSLSEVKDKKTKPFIGSAQYPAIDDKEKNIRLNQIFSNEQWENRRELQKLNLLDRRFIHDFCEFSIGNDSDTWVYRKGKIFTAADSNEELILEGGKFTPAMEGGLIRVYDVNDKNRIIYQTRINKIKSGGRRVTVSESYRVGMQSTKLPKMSYELQYVRSQEVKKDDLKNLAVFGDNRNLLITNWELDNITFDDYPYSAVIRFYKPLPIDIQVKDTFHIVRELTPPIIENVVLESGDEDSDGYILRPPSFDVEDKYLRDTSRATQLENWEDLLGSDPQTSEKLIDSIAANSSASVDINVDYTKFENFLIFRLF